MIFQKHRNFLQLCMLLVVVVYRRPSFNLSHCGKKVLLSACPLCRPQVVREKKPIRFILYIHRLGKFNCTIFLLAPFWIIQPFSIILDFVLYGSSINHFAYIRVFRVTTLQIKQSLHIILCTGKYIRYLHLGSKKIVQQQLSPDIPPSIHAHRHGAKQDPSTKSSPEKSFCQTWDSIVRGVQCSRFLGPRPTRKNQPGNL